MRHIGHLPDVKQAQTFGDLLVTKGIPNEIATDADGSSLIWIRDDDHLAQAKDWLTKFQAAPGAAEFRDIASQAAKARKAKASEMTEYQSRVRTRKSLFPSFGAYGVGMLTYTLIGICVAVALFSKFGGDENWVRQLLISDAGKMAPGFLPDVIQHGEFWRLLTPAFLHFGVLHLLFNMMWLYQLGCMIEARQSALRLLLLVVVTGIFSNLAQYLVDGPQFGGMSGVVYALAGYVWMRGKHDRASGLFLDQQSVTILLVWLVVCFTGLVGPVANIAHFAGLVSGMAIGRVSGYLAMRKSE